MIGGAVTINSYSSENAVRECAISINRDEYDNLDQNRLISCDMYQEDPNMFFGRPLPKSQITISDSKGITFVDCEFFVYDKVKILWGNNYE